MELKKELLDYYRTNIGETISEASTLKKNTDRSKKINKKMKQLLHSKIKNNDSSNTTDLNFILMANYTYYVVMLESRNKVWNYDYMAFSRRIGELWEPFCKLAFTYSKNEVSFYEPMSYDDYKVKIALEINDYIDSLDLENDQTDKLKEYVDGVWELAESGAINLKEDLHFIYDNNKYVVDFKSGFSSNEKGNVNRLLQVAKLYTNIDYKCIIFVRQKEEDNNHYLQTIKNSKNWNVYCSDETYQKIMDITGVNLKKWMTENMNWIEDISSEFRDYLEMNNLLQYLTW